MFECRQSNPYIKATHIWLLIGTSFALLARNEVSWTSKNKRKFQTQSHSNLWFHSNMINFCSSFLVIRCLVITMILVTMIPTLHKNVYHPFITLIKSRNLLDRTYSLKKLRWFGFSVSFKLILLFYIFVSFLDVS